MRIPRIAATLLACAAAVAVPATAASAAAADPVTSAQYVTMRDGVRIAVDVTLPAGLPPGKRIGAVVEATRYHRAEEGDGVSGAARFWTAAGYALVDVDARGTGASFGSRSGEWSRAEVRDYDELLDWIAQQPWSNGRAGAIGTSYSGNTAELMASLGNEHLRAVAPLFPDYDVYEDLAMPGGVRNSMMLDTWLALTRALDGIDGAACDFGKLTGQSCEEAAAGLGTVKPVDGPDGPALRAAAVRDHQRSLDLRRAVARMGFKDDRGSSFGWSDGAGYAHRRATERAGVPMLTAASWLDAGTANGSLARLLSLDVPQEAYIGAWSHGASFTTDPFRPAAERGAFERDELMARVKAFFDRHVQRGERPRPGRTLHYSTLGERAWRTTARWPLAGTRTTRWYLRAGSALARERPSERRAADRHRPDPRASSGGGRWKTQLGGDDVVYPDRRREDRRLLTYTSPPLARAAHVAGLARITLQLASSRPDGTLIAYLEDVAPNGRVTYLTEGQLRLASRAVARRDAPHRLLRTPRTFARGDARPMVPGRVEPVVLDLLPTSARIAAGHRLRIAIAGADAGLFAQLPADGKVTYTVRRDRAKPSYVDVPVAP